ncbi:hypothetical protein GlitD10_2392 [Gloeomargarita lithophora Alchichica-D10]|uniref:Uncharacterized protein n=1 Tax=Gloeomargarita lithophora Alchichica-D10 TaxID=1188229 RepID=A0A1J0AFL0_9CYAN|nr:hypothetical protein [Gloeomargarita lithophora]APB34726.1 hypothetical protein GlitD10_2392 [Gloeomargarita lithophora Alchichica-D10]
MTARRIIHLTSYGLTGLILFFWLHFYQTSGWIFWVIVGLGVILCLGIVAEIITMIFLEPIKQKILRDFPQNLTFIDVKVADHPHLDRATLDRWTDTFEYLGFQRLGDFSIQVESGNQPPSLLRLLIHPRHRCFGEIHQVFPSPSTLVGLYKF